MDWERKAAARSSVVDGFVGQIKVSKHPRIRKLAEQVLTSDCEMHKVSM